MSSGERLPLSVVGPVAAALREQLAPTCARVEFAGSLRRAVGGDMLVGDIELVAIPHPMRLKFGVPVAQQRTDMDALLADLVQREVIRRWPVDLARAAWGDKYKKFWIPVTGRWVQVDLFLAAPENWGAIFTIRTGPSDFSRALVTHIRYKTPYVQEDGQLRRQATGEIVPVPEEEDYFAAVGVQWIPAVQRTGAKDVIPVQTWTAGDEAVRAPDQQQLTLF